MNHNNNQRYQRISKQAQDKTHKFTFRISHYATTHTAESVYILGGWNGNGVRSFVIAEYKDDTWSNAGSMKRNRYGHSAITFGSTCIIFGNPDETIMEKLDLNTLESEIVNISNSPVNTFSKFVVPNGFCSAN